MGRSFHKIRDTAIVSRHSKRDPAASCDTGGFYKSPTIGQTVDSASPFNIAWDTSCLTTEAVDIYLFAPSANHSRIQLWENVPFRKGSFQTTLKPKWWNATSSETLQLTIIDAGKQPFESAMPAGPVFTATYTAPASGKIPADADITKPDSGVTNVASLAANEKRLTDAKIAVAVLIPILFIALGIAAFLKISRKKTQVKSKRWSEAVDKRMSTISSDWKSLSAAGANAAIRHSLAVSGNGSNRASAFSFGNIRPLDSAHTQGGKAGAGARGLYSHDNSDIGPQMSQLRSGSPAAPFANRASQRMSKVSFAADPRGVSYADSRPSMEGRRNVASRVSNNPFVHGSQKLDVDSTQREGPLSLTPEDIRSRLTGSSDGRPSVDEVMPALSMMRTGIESPDGTEDGKDDYLLWEATTPTTPLSPGSTITPPAPVATQPPATQPTAPTITVMSPDEMLRAYAAKRAAAAAATSTPTTPITPLSSTSSPDDMLRAYAERTVNGGGPAFPPPAAMYNGNGIRTLYSPNAPPTAASTRSSSNARKASIAKKFKKSMGASDQTQTNQDTQGATAL